MSTDLAYEDPSVGPEATAAVVDAFADLFGAYAEFFTQSDLGEDMRSKGGSQLTGATMEEGVAAVGGGRAGMIILTCED